MSTDYIDAEVTAIQAADAAPHFAITTLEAARRFQEFKAFVHSQMVNGEDYGVIPGTGEKPTLLKSGAEKLTNLFGFAISYQRTEYESDDDFVEFAYRCDLTSRRTGALVASCEAFCNSAEKPSWTNAPLKFKNTIAKIAQKRALVGATLHATRASGMFTQDLEDMPESASNDKPKTKASGESGDNYTYKCEECGSEVKGHTKDGKWISAKWKEQNSHEKHGKALCYDCVKKLAA